MADVSPKFNWKPRNIKTHLIIPQLCNHNRFSRKCLCRPSFPAFLWHPAVKHIIKAMFFGNFASTRKSTKLFGTILINFGPFFTEFVVKINSLISKRRKIYEFYSSVFFSSLSFSIRWMEVDNRYRMRGGKKYNCRQNQQINIETRSLKAS